MIPGLETPPLGAVPGMALRAYDWPMVTYAQIATDPSGAVYVAGFQLPNSGSTVPVASGAFVARLNVDLSVQWLRPLPNSDGTQGDLYLRSDPQGNVWVAWSNATTSQIVLAGFNPNGSARTGFPVSFGSGSLDRVRGLAVDFTGNVHLRSGAAAAARSSREPIP